MPATLLPSFPSLMTSLLYLFLLTSTTTVFSQTEPIAPIQNPNWEVWNKKIPVSGEIRTGLMVDQMEPALIQRHFFVQIPREKFKTLCVEISSNDGRYEAHLEYDISGIKPGVHQFKWPTQYYDDLKKMNTQQITILARVGDKCDLNPDQFVLTSWRKSDFNNEMYIILNSEKKAFVRIVNKDTGKKTDYKSTLFSNQPNVAYNCFCRVPISNLDENSQVFVVQRIRMGPGKVSFNSYEMPVKL